MMKRTTGEKIFNVINITILTIIIILSLYPLVYVFSASLSPARYVRSGAVLLLPRNITFYSFAEIFGTGEIWWAYVMTMFYTVVGSAVSVIITIFLAYGLSKPRLRFRAFLTFVVILSMWFSAGLIPIFVNLLELGLTNPLGLIIGFAMSAFNMILLRTYFESIPDSLEEAATIDGANDLGILFRIMIPLAVPAIATITLFYAIERWNGWFWASTILTEPRHMPLQVLLRGFIIDAQRTAEFSMPQFSRGGLISQETVIYATIVVSVIPMMLFYPFIQKFFVKGIMVGAVKG